MTPEQRAIAERRIKLYLDVDTERGTVRWKDPLPPSAGKRAKAGQEIKTLVVQDEEYNRVNVTRSRIIWFAATGEWPARIYLLNPRARYKLAYSNLRAENEDNE